METQPAPVLHIVSVPYPGRGHINPMMNLCKTIATKQPNIVITFVVTEEWFGLIGKDPKPENINFATIRNVLPSEHIRARNFQEFFEAVLTNMEGPFEQVLDEIRHPPLVIVADIILFWAVKLGNRRNVPVALLNSISMTAFMSYFHTSNLCQEESKTTANLPAIKTKDIEQRSFDNFSITVVEKGDDSIDCIPQTPAEGSANQPAQRKEERRVQRFRLIFSWVPKAQYLLFASVEELEQNAFDAIRSQFSIPLYTVGPNIPVQLEKKPSSSPKQNKVDYLQWLDSQLSDSILYISFGSFLSISAPQMDEIAAALCSSGVRFLWVARNESTRLTKIVGGNGLVVPWCDQLSVLTHCSVGGFWTHCGWGSIMEGILAGVPFLASPIGMDQHENCKLVVEDWKVGWRANTETSSKIEELVLKFMDLQDDESRTMRRRVKELQEICQQAMRSDGSSQVNVNAFINDILQVHGH